MEGKKNPTLTRWVNAFASFASTAGRERPDHEGSRPAIDAKSQIPRKDVLVLFNVSCDRYAVRYFFVGRYTVSSDGAVEKIGNGTDFLFDFAQYLPFIFLLVREILSEVEC